MVGAILLIVAGFLVGCLVVDWALRGSEYDLWRDQSAERFELARRRFQLRRWAKGDRVRWDR